MTVDLCIHTHLFSGLKTVRLAAKIDIALNCTNYTSPPPAVESGNIAVYTNNICPPCVT